MSQIIFTKYLHKLKRHNLFLLKLLKIHFNNFYISWIVLSFIWGKHIQTLHTSPLNINGKRAINIPHHSEMSLAAVIIISSVHVILKERKTASTHRSNTTVSKFCIKHFYEPKLRPQTSPDWTSIEIRQPNKNCYIRKYVPG